MQTDMCTVRCTGRSVLLTVRNVSDKIYGGNKKKTHFVFNNIFFENRAFYEIMWKNMVETGRPHMRIWYMRIVCWIPEATNTNSQYVILLAFSTATMVAWKGLNFTSSFSVFLVTFIFIRCFSFVCISGHQNTQIRSTFGTVPIFIKADI